jgi:maleate isomerase
MYGWRARIGSVLASRGDTATYEFYKIIPEGIVLVSSCLNIYNLTTDQLREAEKKYDEAAIDLAKVGVDIIILGGSPLFQLKGVGSDREAIDRVEKLTNIMTTTGITSEIEALRHLNIKKLIVATPFKDELNVRAKRFLEAHNFNVLGIKGLGIQKNSEIANLPLHAPYRLSKELFLKHPDADGIYIACPRWGTIGIIDKLEQDLKMPVVTSRAATVWNALRKLNIGEPIRGYGTLLEHD